MTPRDYLNEWVRKAGGRPKAAQRLGVPYSTLAAICNGTRGVSRQMALTLAAASGGQLDAAKLVWIDVGPTANDAEAA